MAALGHTNVLEKVATALTGAEARLVTPAPEPEAWDEKRGGTLLTTLRALQPLPEGTRRVLMLGNSQQYTVPRQKMGAQ